VLTDIRPDDGVRGRHRDALTTGLVIGRDGLRTHSSDERTPKAVESPENARNPPTEASLRVMSERYGGPACEAADALSVEGWRRGIVHEGPDV
jgi:hypothetical protein